MKEEELIKKLESVKLPRIELQSHRRRLRLALLSAGYLQRQRQVTILELAKSKVKGGIETMIRGLVSRQPVWKPVLASVLAIAVIIGLTMLPGQSAQALAADIARNSPEVRAALSGQEIQVVKVINVVDDKATVVCVGKLGVGVTAEVDLKTKEVTEVVSMPALTEADKEKAISIAKADPRVKRLLDAGVNIAEVLPAYSFKAWVNPQTGEIEESLETLAIVKMELAGKIGTAHVDLREETVVKLVWSTEPLRGDNQGALGGTGQGRLPRP